MNRYDRAALGEAELSAEIDVQVEAATNASPAPPTDESEQRLLAAMTSLAEASRHLPDARIRHLAKRQSGAGVRPEPKTGKVGKGGPRRREAAATQAYLPSKTRLPLSWLVGGGVLVLCMVGLLAFFLLRPSDKQASGENKLPDGNKLQAGEEVKVDIENDERSDIGLHLK